MTGKESQEQIIHNTEEIPQQKKPRRRSIFQISKGQMISTKELLLQKLKPSSASQKRSEEMEPPLTSPVELPHIEQLEPINTDISSEIQFHQQQTENHQGDATTGADESGAAQDIADQVNQVDNHHHPDDKNSSEVKKQQDDDAENTQAASGDDNNNAEVVDPLHKKDQPIVKRSSILLKYLFPKKATSINTDDVIVTESAIIENHHQAELGAGNDTSAESTDKHDKYDSTEEISENNEEKQKTEAPSPHRPSSPLGRRINAFLSRIPTYKEKPSSGNNNNSKPVETIITVDEITKKESATADVPDTNYENEKVTTTTATVIDNTLTNKSNVAV